MRIQRSARAFSWSQLKPALNPGVAGCDAVVCLSRACHVLARVVTLGRPARPLRITLASISATTLLPTFPTSTTHAAFIFNSSPAQLRATHVPSYAAANNISRSTFRGRVDIDPSSHRLPSSHLDKGGHRARERYTVQERGESERESRVVVGPIELRPLVTVGRPSTHLRRSHLRPR